MNVQEQLKPCHLYFDGACERKNSEMGFGVVIKSYDKKEVLFTHSENKIVTSPKEKFSNNVAEYQSLKIGLEWLIENKINKVIVRGDSQLVVMQMNNKWSVSGGQYKALALECKRLKENFIMFQCEWIPRSRNGFADKLSKLNMRSHARKN